MKKLITIFLTLFMLISTAACQPTPDEQIVVKKDTERMVERAAAQAARACCHRQWRGEGAS